MRERSLQNVDLTARFGSCLIQARGSETGVFDLMRVVCISYLKRAKNHA